jgi:hypothetical protein
VYRLCQFLAQANPLCGSRERTILLFVLVLEEFLVDNVDNLELEDGAILEFPIAGRVVQTLVSLRVGWS